MPTEVDIPELGIIEFPDELSADDISNEVRRLTGEQSAPNLGNVLASERPQLPEFVSASGIPEPPSSMIPLIDWDQRQQSESFAPNRQDLQLGVPSAVGVTPEMVPSGRRLTEQVLGIPEEFGDPFREESTAMRALDVPMTVASSVAKTGIGLGEYLSSPQGVTELVLSMTPAKLLVLGKWAKDMAGGAWSEGREMEKLLLKKDKTSEDWQSLSDRTVTALTMTAGLLGAGAGAGKEIKTLSDKLNIPEGKIKLEDRGNVLQEMFNRDVFERQLAAGSPFVTREAPAQPVGMGFRTQPTLSEAVESTQPPRGGIPMRGVEATEATPPQVLPTFQPSGLGRPLPPQVEVQTGFHEVQPPQPVRAVESTQGRAAQKVRLQGEAEQRLADWEKAMAEKVSLEQGSPKHPDKPLTDNQLKIILDSLQKELLEGQIGERRGIVSGSALELWADKTIGEAGQKFYSGIPFDSKLMAAGVIKGAAMLERGITNAAEWTAAMIKEFGPEIKPMLAQIRNQSEKVRGGVFNAIQQEAKGVVRDVRQPEVAQKGAGEVPTEVSGGAPPEARVIADAIGMTFSGETPVQVPGMTPTWDFRFKEPGNDMFSVVVPAGTPKAEIIKARDAKIEQLKQSGDWKTPPKTTLDDVYNRFTPEANSRRSIGTAISDFAGQSLEAIRTGLSSRFRPLDKLAEDISKMYGGGAKRIAHIFEQLKGSSGKAEADVYRFDRDVSRIVRGSEKDFNAYMFLRRSLDRLRQDLSEGDPVGRRRVSGYTIPELESKLAQLESNLGAEKVTDFQRASDLYQQHMDSALRLQVESGRMSQELYDAIKSTNLFYAPFKVLKYLDETSRPEGSGRKIDTVADFTKAMTGIEDPNFKLGDMLSAARQSITMSRILAEKNAAMRKFAEVVADDAEGVFVRKLAPEQSTPKDMETVNVMENGKTVKYAVDPAVAEAVKVYNAPTAETVSRFLRYAAAPFRIGATTANVAFQPVNLLLADAPRAALVSKYGIKGASDVVGYPVDMVQSMYSSMVANLLKKENKLYLDYLDSGAAGAVIQDYLSPKMLKYREPGVGTAAARFAKSVISKPAEFAKAIEETNKVLGIKRAMRIEGATSGKDLAARIPEAITEVRRFSGSPDFGRIGSWTEAGRLNLLYMFLNARIQGAVADVGRLTGRDGGKTAAKTWAKMMTAVGVPTAILYYYNNLPQYKADYDKRPKWEKDNYFLIPRDRFIEDENGEKIRDYWRIPKREMVQLTANIIDSGLHFAQERDPEAFTSLAMNTIENVSPVNIRGNNFQERMESTLASLNPLIKAPIELGTGRDLFRHRDIVPDVMKKASPEQQYTDRTPEIYRTLSELMPDVSPEALRSPLLLEAGVRDFTANLINQFIPQKPVKGREGIGNAPLLQPLLRRFQGAPYVDTEQERETINELQRQAADAFLAKDRAARDAIENANDPGQVAQTIFDNQGYNQQSIATVERAVDLWIAKKNGITREERMVLNLPVEQRAAYVTEKLKGLNGTQQAELMDNLVRKRIATQSVLEKDSAASSVSNFYAKPVTMIPGGIPYTDSRVPIKKFPGMEVASEDQQLDRIIGWRKQNPAVYPPDEDGGKYLSKDWVRDNQLRPYQKNRLGNNKAYFTDGKSTTIPMVVTQIEPLRPCPKCGASDAKVEYCKSCRGSRPKYFVCLNCGERRGL